jgi:23S rRNA pseudouridine1911/1915/1917 synthase
MSETEITVPEEFAGARLDKALVQLAKGSSRAKVKRALDEGAVKVNGRARPKGTTLREGDRITFHADEIAAGDVAAIAEPGAALEVLLKAEHYVVVNKPAGQPCAPLRAGEQGTVANALLAHFPEMKGIGYSVREPGLIHRLDNETSGVLLAARTAEGFKALRQALVQSQISKRYLLVCESAKLPDEGTIEHPIANHPKDEKRVLACIHPRDVMRNAPRPATTHFRVVSRHGERALVEVSAAKALRHQIRVHFASIECPLLGDSLYGGISVEGLTRHALHASHIELAGELPWQFHAEAPLPSELQRLLT